jgi:hypothetical protein
VPTPSAIQPVGDGADVGAAGDGGVVGADGGGGE